MTITKQDYEVLRARRACPIIEGWKSGALTIFVPGTPKHFKGHGDRYTVSKHTKDWRERTASRLLAFAHQGARRDGVGSRP